MARVAHRAAPGVRVRCGDVGVTHRLLRAHEARLRAAFERILVVSLVLPGATSCAAHDSQTAARDGGAADGNAGLDASQDVAPFPTCAEASAGAPYRGTDTCYYYVNLSCPEYAPRGTTCTLNAPDCLTLCTLEAGIFECRYLSQDCLNGRLTAEAGQTVTVGCATCPGGRRPVGLRRAQPRRAASALGDYLARASHLEAASVHAFERLHDELRAHGAPRELWLAARRSARDEARHARVTARLACRHGGEVPIPRLRPRRTRSLRSMALENATEGCVRETFGALVAMWQAARARDLELRRCMAAIAEDETRHAALAWAVARWAEARLDARARASVARKRVAALTCLERELGRALPPELVRDAGLPNASQGCALLRAMKQEVGLGR
jgi:hypothetical protein